MFIKTKSQNPLKSDSASMQKENLVENSGECNKNIKLY